MAQRPQQSSPTAFLKLYPLESVLAAVLLVALLYTAYLFQQTLAKQTEVDEVNAAVSQLTNRLNSITSSNTEQELRDQLQFVQGEIATASTLPTQQQAMAIGTDMISYADQQRLRILSFDDAPERVVLGGVERSAVGYAIAAQGDAQSLIGMLSILQGASSVQIKDLELDRSEDTPEEWILELETVVFFADPS